MARRKGPDHTNVLATLPSEPPSEIPAEHGGGGARFGVRQGEVENVVLQSFFGNRFYFCRKVRVWDDGRACEVRGQKFDVTEHLQPFLLKKYRRKS